MVGDSVSDILAGRNAGCRGRILVRTGHDLTEALALLGMHSLVANDLGEAAEGAPGNRHRRMGVGHSDNLRVIPMDHSMERNRFVDIGID